MFDVKDLKKVRTEKGLTQSYIALRVGVSIYAYQIWERGTSTPNPGNLKKLKKVLGIK